jgi:DNA-binding transcriptional LysR family regulator
MMRYDWNDLKFFLEVARRRTLSAAARALACDHVTVSRRITSLEQSMGAALFHRSPLGYMITPAGATLLTFAEQVESAALGAAEALNSPGIGIAGKIRLSMPDGFGNHFLARRLQAFTATYPMVTLELITVPQILSLSQREGDVTVSLSPPTRGRFRTEKLTDYHLGLYAARSYIDAVAGDIEAGSLKRHRFVGYVDDLIFSRELDYLGEIASGLKAQMQSTSLFAQVMATSEGQGICVLPHFIAREFEALIRVAPDVFLQRSYWMSSHEDIADLPRVKAVRNFIQSVCAESGAILLEARSPDATPYAPNTGA